MTLSQKIQDLYPALGPSDFIGPTATIFLQNDSDGRGDYIREWNHPTLPKPTPEQLAEVTP
jgi:hypothetical protein